MTSIKDLKPEIVWHNFDALTKVPRPSGHVEKVQQFLLDFAAQNGVEAFKDPAGNIYMSKPASKGMEGHKGVILQAHMDMVPQKAPDSNHNFLTDPIETHVEGDWLYANHTTLGSDDGLGVAVIMAVMEDKTLEHGPVEALITRDEETGMYGANDLPKGELKGKVYLNLDSETFGEFVIGSAGGIDITAELGYKPEAVPAGMKAMTITVKGLKGGHSGLEINLGRANANKLLVRMVRDMIAENGARLAVWHGGNMRNAIPFEATATLVLPESQLDAVRKSACSWQKEFQREYEGIESCITVLAAEAEQPADVLPAEIQDNLADAIYACHDGVVRMIPSIPGVVETSSNLAIIEIGSGKASFKILARSSDEQMKRYVAMMLESCFSMAGMKVTFSGDYMGWEPNYNSQLLKLVTDVYKEQTGKEGKVQCDHAGLECSVILSKYPDLDVVSMGPTLRSPHTASERCQISTVAPFWELIKEVLRRI